MASERQIVANRRNARKSTGPRSGAGRERASRNAYLPDVEHHLDRRICETVGNPCPQNRWRHQDPIKLERARAIAQAELELARVRRAKVALIERASAFGELDSPRLTEAQTTRLFNAFLGGRLVDPKPIDASATMPPQEPDRSAEAIRRVLPELCKLERYECRAAARRDRAIVNFIVEQSWHNL